MLIFAFIKQEPRGMTQIDEDILLLNLIKEDDKLAFKYLFHKYMGNLCQFIDFFIHDKVTSEDLALELFASIWEIREELEIKQSFKSYLFQAARNKALTYLRDKKEYSGLDEAELLIDTTNDAAFEAEANELYRLIEEAVTLLPERCREIYQKSRNEEMSNREIAARMQISEKTVENQITIALKKIKKFLNRKYL